MNEVRSKFNWHLLLLGVVVGAALGAAVLTSSFMHLAVKTGHAEFFIDADNDKQFRWKTNCVDLANCERKDIK